MGILVTGALSCATRQERVGKSIQRSVEREHWSEADSLVGVMNDMNPDRGELYATWVRKKKFEAMRAEMEDALGGSARITTLEEGEAARLSEEGSAVDTSASSPHMGSGYRALGRALARSDGDVADDRINLGVLSIPPSTAGGPEGLRTQSEIEAVAAGTMNLLVSCFQRAIDEHGDVNGTVIIRFEVDTQGRVTDAGVLQSSLEIPSVEECLVVTVRSWELAPGVEQEMDWPFTFETR